MTKHDKFVNKGKGEGRKKEGEREGRGGRTSWFLPPRHLCIKTLNTVQLNVPNDSAVHFLTDPNKCGLKQCQNVG